MLWQDKNGNGVVDTGELLTLEEVGVADMNLGYTDSYYVDENGNAHRQKGSFICADGSAGQMTDVWFTNDLADTIYLDQIEVSDEIKTLPNLRGYGNTPSLHQVMATETDGRLKALVEEFILPVNSLTGNVGIVIRQP